jgi:hypothetical protein
MKTMIFPGELNKHKITIREFIAADRNDESYSAVVMLSTFVMVPSKRKIRKIAVSQSIFRKIGCIKGHVDL